MRWRVIALTLLCVLPIARAQAAAPRAVVLLSGTVVTSDAVLQNGWVAIDNGKIVSVTADKPNIPAARVLATGDIIFPGFVDLHNHPLYNVYPRWTPPVLYGNRYQWRSAPEYVAALAEPHGKVVAANFCDMDAFVELKGLFGGTTTTLGISQPRDTSIACIAGLARNLDWFTGFYGTAVGQERVRAALGVQPGDIRDTAPALAASLRNGQIDLMAIHIAEGQRNDPLSQGEFAELEKLGLLTPRTAIIHGVALTRADFAKVHAAGAALVWSPRSNFELYGETARINDAAAENVTIALAPDWSPTGSTNMLAELKFAKRISDSRFNALFSAKQLFEMASSIPARIAHIDDKVGALKPGLYADLFLLRGDPAHPYDALVNAAPDDVALTMVGGVAISGDVRYLTALGVTQAEPTTVCTAQVAINTQALAGGSLADIKKRLNKALTDNKVGLGPMAECY
ncbi:MAG: amidohydrolase family protein [Rhodospirillaceae bacterium]